MLLTSTIKPMESFLKFVNCACRITLINSIGLWKIAVISFASMVVYERARHFLVPEMRQVEEPYQISTLNREVGQLKSDVLALQRILRKPEYLELNIEQSTIDNNIWNILRAINERIEGAVVRLNRLQIQLGAGIFEAHGEAV